MHVCMYKSHLLHMYVLLPLIGDGVFMAQDDSNIKYSLLDLTHGIRASLEV